MAEKVKLGNSLPRLVVTVGAVHNHITAIFDKLGLRAKQKTTGACWRCSDICGIESRG